MVMGPLSVSITKWSSSWRMAVHGGVFERGAELSCLFLHLLGEIVAVDGVGKPGIVLQALDQQGLAPRRKLFEDQGPQVPRAPTGAARADDDQVLVRG